MDSNRTQGGSSTRAAGDLTVKSDMRPNRCRIKQIQRSRVFYEMRRKFDASARCTAEERAPWKCRRQQARFRRIRSRRLKSRIATFTAFAAAATSDSRSRERPDFDIPTSDLELFCRAQRLTEIT